MKTLTFIILSFITTISLPCAAQDHAIEKDSTDYGLFYIDTMAYVFIFMGKANVAEDEQEIYLEDILLSMGKGIDSTHFLIRISAHGETYPETYFLSQQMVAHQGEMIPTTATLDVGAHVIVQKLTIWEADYRPAARCRVLHVVVDLIEK